MSILHKYKMSAMGKYKMGILNKYEARAMSTLSAVLRIPKYTIGHQGFRPCSAAGRCFGAAPDTV